MALQYQTEPPMNTELVDDLISAFNNMEICLNQLKKSLNTERLPTWLPGPDCNTPQINEDKKREIIQHDFCRLWKADLNLSAPPSGLICLTAAQIKAVIAVNRSKEHFKNAVQAVKKSMGAGDKGRNTLEHLATIAEANRIRHPKVAEALTAANISALDLNHCYRQIRILPADLESISWTWAKRHSEVKKLKVGEALELTQHISSARAKVVANQLLGRLNPSEELAFYKAKRAQLRANISWLDDMEDLQRKMVTVSGVLVLQQSDLPIKIKWPQDKIAPPSEEARQQRFDKKIDSDAYIQSINIHRYTE